MTLGLMAEAVILLCTCAGRAGQGQRTDVNFAAAFFRWENFLGIQQALRVEGVAHAAHHVEIGFAEEQRHQAIFFHADAVFAGDRAAHFDAELNDFVGGGDDAAELRFVARVEKNQRVQVAVARVKNIADLEAVLHADFIDAAQGGGKFGARDHAVLHVIGGREAADGAEGVLAAFPEQVAFAGVAGHADFAGVMGAANVGDFFGVCLHGFGEAVHFEQQDGGAIERKSGVDVGFDGAERPAVEHFAGGGSDAARGDVHDGFGGVVESFENREESFYGFGQLRVSFTVISVTSASVPSEPTKRPRRS